MMPEGVPPPSLKISLASVGWDDDPVIVDQGMSDTSDTDGATLVKVQLYQGRNPLKPLTKGRAQGTKIRAQVLGPLYYIPPQNARVVVAFPDGFERIAGSAIILGTVGRTPTTAFDKTNVNVQPLGATILNLMGGADYIALAKKVDQWMKDIKQTFDSHTHDVSEIICAGSGSPATGLSGVPSTASPALPGTLITIPDDGSVAAEKTKAT